MVKRYAGLYSWSMASAKKRIAKGKKKYKGKYTFSIKKKRSIGKAKRMGYAIFYE
jgi:hypothetical protein